jgi:hypothetical protein
MHDLSPAKAIPTRHQGWASAIRTFAIVMGGSGIGLIGGLCYGARLAVRYPAADELASLLSWGVALVLYGVIGFVIGLAAGLLVMIMIWILRLANHLTRGLR